MASFHEQIKEENFDYEEEFKKFHGTIFQKMLKDSIDLAVSILTSQKRNEDEEIHEEKIKELIEEIMEEKIKLLGSYLNKE